MQACIGVPTEKRPWASAVVSQYPFMASFTIPAHSDTEYSYAAGMELDSTFEDHRHPYSATAVPGRVALDGFLKESCNKYVVDFVTATLAMKDEAKGEPSIRDLAEVMNFSNKEMPVPERFAVCGSTAERVPKFDRFVDRGSFHMPEQNPVDSTFESITGVKQAANNLANIILGQPSSTFTSRIALVPSSRTQMSVKVPPTSTATR